MTLSWKTFTRLPDTLTVQAPDSEEQIDRIRYMERNIGLPVKAGVIAVLIYYLFLSNWLEQQTAPTDPVPDDQCSSS